MNGRGGSWGLKADVPDVEVFLEAVRLQQIGKLEGADIAAAFADLALQVEDDPPHLGHGEALLEQLVPLPFAPKIQSDFLAGEMAVELVGFQDFLAINGNGHGWLRKGAWARRGRPGELAHRARFPARFARGRK